MKKIEITTHIQVYSDISELEPEHRQLLLAARSALEYAYVPYSNFRVGAAVLLDDGRIISGANQENASYPMCMCAERVALGNVNMKAQDQKITAMAITVQNPNRLVGEPATPCGACRQVICEQEQRQQQPFPLILQGQEGEIYLIPSGRDLLPLGFDGSFL